MLTRRVIMELLELEPLSSNRGRARDDELDIYVKILKNRPLVVRDLLSDVPGIRFLQLRRVDVDRRLIATRCAQFVFWFDTMPIHSADFPFIAEVRRHKGSFLARMKMRIVSARSRSGIDMVSNHKAEKGN